MKVSRDGEMFEDVGPETLAVTTRKKAIAAVESRASKARLSVVDEEDLLVLVAAGKSLL